MDKQIFLSLESFLKENKSLEFAIFIHRDPDGDCLASSLALKKMFSLLKIKSNIYSFDKPAPSYDFLPKIDEIIIIDKKKFKKLILANLKKELIFVSVDCCVISQIFKNIDQDKETDFKIDINIDHHKGNNNYGFINIVDYQMSSCGEVIFDLFQSFKLDLDKEVAMLIYVAISTDTGHFRFANANAHTFKTASYLLEKGIDNAKINNLIYEQVSIAYFKKLADGLANLKQELNGRIIFISIENDADFGPKGLIDYIREIKTCQVAVVFKKKELKHTKVSLRSKTDFDVRLFAEYFGGGGHSKAAGISLDLNLEEAEKLIISKLITKLSN